MSKPFNLNLQLFAETGGVNFEEIITKHTGEDGNIPAASISKVASAIASAVGRAFVDKKRYNEKLEELETLKTEKQNTDDELTTAKKWEEKFNKEHEAFEKFKAETDAKENLNNVKAAYKKLLTEAGIDAKRYDVILRATDFGGMKLNEDGTLDKADALKKDIESNWADFRVTTKNKGVNVENPPANTGTKRTKEEIMAIKDTAERQKAIAENHELFGI